MIEFRKVSKEYFGKAAIDSVSFRIGSGTACGYIGPNGAGKTTTAKIIVGLERPDSGEVDVSSHLETPILNDKKENSRTALRISKSEIGYVPESADRKSVV